MKDSFKCLQPLDDIEAVSVFSLPRAEENGAGPISRLPYSIRILVENMLRNEDGAQITADMIRQVVRNTGRRPAMAVFNPERILMQDSSGLPVLADLAALLEAADETDGDVRWRENIRVDLVIDHSVEVDVSGRDDAVFVNQRLELDRNASRYRFLRWAEQRFPWLNVIPPGVGICHQLNLEVLAPVVNRQTRSGVTIAGCDSVIGTDSHTTMINALSVFGWGVGGLEASAVLVGQPITMPKPRVVGVRLTGDRRPGITATDIALSLTAWLRQHGVVNRIVEFCGNGIDQLSIPDRATIANMAPEYGATMGFFPADATTLDYLALTGRSAEQVSLARAFLSAQGLLRDRDAKVPDFNELLTFDLEAVERCLAGPSRPEQLKSLGAMPASGQGGARRSHLTNGSVVIAALSSCTNTANPRLMIAAGIVAKRAAELGLRPPGWVKTSLAPGSRIISTMLEDSGLQTYLDLLGFNLVGHGCTTCMGNSGPLAPDIAETIIRDELNVAAVLCGNRNFEGRIHPLCKSAYLMSPPLVVAYALAGTMNINLETEPVGVSNDGAPAYLSALWPTDEEIDRIIQQIDMASLSAFNIASTGGGPIGWSDIPVHPAATYDWEPRSGFIRRPPFMSPEYTQPLLDEDIVGACALVMLGDGITTDHISPVSRILPDSEAGKWLAGLGVPQGDFGSFSARRLNHEVMLRGGFGNPRLRNLLVPGIEGGFTTLQPDGIVMDINSAAETYRQRNVPMIVIAGARYGTGSARDWAAKVTRQFGVRVVMAESFERIHRTNLVAMGVLPVFLPNAVVGTLQGEETFDLRNIDAALERSGQLEFIIHRPGGKFDCYRLDAAIETNLEARWIRSGGLFPFISRKDA